MRLASLLAVPLAGGCFLQPHCGVESRQLDARAQISAPQVARIERMDVSVGQLKADRTSLLIHWNLTGVDLQYHVQSLGIVEGAADSLLISLPVPAFELAGSATAGFAEAGTADRVYDMILHGRTAIVITTDIPGRERIARTLEYRAGVGWSRPACD